MDKLLRRWQPFLLPLLRRLEPQLESLDDAARYWRMTDILSSLYGLPLALAGLAWLLLRTRPAILEDNVPIFVLLMLLTFLFSRLEFFTISFGRRGTPLLFYISFSTIAMWASVFIFGASALWIPVLLHVALLRPFSLQRPRRLQWEAIEQFVRGLVFTNFSMLVSLHVYEDLGGIYPLPNLTLAMLLPALAALAVWTLVTTLYFIPLLLLVRSPMPLYLIVITNLVNPFSILAAVIYSQLGVAVFMFYMAGVLLVALLAHRLSRAAERSRQRSRELHLLQQIGRELVHTIGDRDALGRLLTLHLPDLFPRTQVEILLFPNYRLCLHPEGEAAATEFWPWLRANPVPHYFPVRAALPWQSDPNPQFIVAVPILDAEGGEAIGGIHLRVDPIYTHWDSSGGASLIPAVQSLASLIASALNRGKVYEQTLTHQMLAQELNLAGEIQASFLPDELPHLPGWTLAAWLEPARQTAGDFYDVIPLPNGSLGIVVADVADKGMGAALLMALSRTLIRTYAGEHVSRPELVLQAANRRILRDTNNDLFVTVFYGILHPRTGEFTYANAGHNPPFLLRQKGMEKLQQARGIPLGLFEDFSWQAAEVTVAPGELLLLYTDGVTEAQNSAGDFLGEEELLRLVQAHRHHNATQIRELLLGEIRQFTGDDPLFDDLTLLIARRENS